MEEELMTYEPTEEEVQQAIAESREEGERWRASATPEQLEAGRASTQRIEEHLLLVYALKMKPDQFTAFAKNADVSDEVLARVRSRMSAPPHDDPEFQAAVETLGGLP
jgi:hypothetical protein